MKVGIMTFHESNNCGSMLQAFALQYFLKNKLDVENDIINFSTKNQQDMYALFRKIDSFKDFTINIATLLFIGKFGRHYKDYKSFSNQYLRKSGNLILNKDDLKKIADNYDVFVCGSDQIWNINCYDADDSYFLNFVSNVKKIAYAPSFGSTKIIDATDNIEVYKKYINDFYLLSCREENGSKWLKELTKKDVPVLFDPTLLLNKDDWETVFNLSCNKKQKYIFYYAFNYSSEVNEKVKIISKKLNLPVYIIDAKWWVKNGFKFGFKLSNHSGPIEFMKMVNNAELVITTSFHGTAFSIIFRKKFWFLNSSMHNKNDDRAITLLKSVGLENRMVELDKIDLNNIDNEIDYKKCENKIILNQKKSLSFLEKGLK